jgi:PKD repeat protein
VIAIFARDVNSQPMPGVALHIDTLLEGSPVDFGSLTTRNLSTGLDGRAQVTFTAPPPPPPTVTSDTTLTFAVTPVSSDYSNAVARFVQLHLLRPGVLVPPPASGLSAEFAFAPDSPTAGDTVVFDGTASKAPAGRTIISFAWTFGDGGSGSGAVVSHQFRTSGSLAVTLRITDDLGRSASAFKSVLVKDNGLKAAFTVSPTSPLVGQTVNFSGTTSVVPPGRSIASYQWDFGNGQFGGGETATAVYNVAGTYTVVLKITDDLGTVATTSKEVQVVTSAPQPSFTISPTSPTAGTVVQFNAAASTAAPGRTIVNYDWDFGQGLGFSSGNSTASHTYPAAGTFTVTLTVRDSQGVSNTLTKTVTINP